MGDFRIYAQDGKAKHWKVELMGALNNYAAWEVEPSVTYQPVRYAGLTIGLLFCNPIGENGISGLSQDKLMFWNSADDDNGSYFFALRPSFQFLSPRIWLGVDKDYALSLSISPGLTIALPVNREFDIEYVLNRPGAQTPVKIEHVKNKNASPLFYHLKSGLSLEIDESLVFSVGYVISNFDLYGGSRNIIIEGERVELEKHHMMHSFFLGIGYRF